MAIVISGVNNNDKITASDGTIDLLSGVNYIGEITAPSLKVGSNIQFGNAGNITATTFVGNLTGNVNGSSNPILLQIDGTEKFRVGTSGQLGIGGANYGSSGQVLTSAGSGSAPTWSTVSVGGGTGIDFNDNVKIRFGTGNDLEIYHTGSGAAILNAAGSGQLTIGSDNALQNIDIIKHIGDLIGKEPKYEFVEDRKGHDRRYTLNTDFEKPKITKTLYEYLEEKL